jgi:hypothetical protein
MEESLYQAEKITEVIEKNWRVFLMMQKNRKLLTARTLYL